MFTKIDVVNAQFNDFGASLNMSCNKYWFDEYYENIDGTYVYLGDNRSYKVQSYGLIDVNFLKGQERERSIM